MSSAVLPPGLSRRLPPDSAVGAPLREVVSLDSLVTDAGTQVRSDIDDAVVDEYVQALLDGAQFPPLVVFRVDGVHLLADGYHRVSAYRKAGRSETGADVYHGTREDALWFALGANRAHGQRLSGGDKRRAIELAYRAWPDLSQVRIAAQVGCAQQYVSEVRAQLTATCMLPDRVVGVDGRLRPATRPTSSSRRPSSLGSGAGADFPPPVAGDGASVAGADSSPSVPLAVPSDPGKSSVPPSESSVPQCPATDVGRPPASSSPGSPPALSGAGLATSRSAPDRSNASVPDVDSAPSALRALPDPGGNLVPLSSSESPVSQRSATDVDRPPASSSSGSPPAPSGAGVTASRSARDRSNRIVSVVAYDAKNLTAQEDLIDFALLDSAQLAGWIADLEEARRGLGRFIRRLRQEVADGSSSTPFED